VTRTRATMMSKTPKGPVAFFKRSMSAERTIMAAARTERVAAQLRAGDAASAEGTRAVGHQVANHEILSEVLSSGLGVVTLNRPKQLNSLTLEMIRELTRVLRLWAGDDAVKVGETGRDIPLVSLFSRLGPRRSSPDSVRAGRHASWPRRQGLLRGGRHSPTCRGPRSRARLLPRRVPA
jgi:hypothetical protein